MDLTSLSKEQLIALLSAQAASQRRHAVEFAAWRNERKTEDWHADLNFTFTFGVVDMLELCTEALANGKTELKVFGNGYDGSGAENAPIVRGYSDLKEKTPKAAEKAA